ncbi:MAG: ELWxxDGT repeat protein, partial [Thermoanaerobaculia bacterium]
MRVTTVVGLVGSLVSTGLLVALAAIGIPQPAAAAEPILVRNINRGSESSQAASFVRLEGEVYFAADDGRRGRVLWRTDGTPGGTIPVSDLHPGADERIVSDLHLFDGALLFFAADGNHRERLWRSDGTEAGSSILKEIRQGPEGDDCFSLGWGGVDRSCVATLAEQLLFVGDDGVNGVELWATDGTAAGTVMVRDIDPDGSSYPSRLITVGDVVYFRADDGVHGQELWQSDGTEAGTVMVQDLDPGFRGSFPSWLTEMGGTLYFSAFDGTADRLWALPPGAETPLRGTGVRPTDPIFPTWLTALDDTLY